LNLEELGTRLRAVVITHHGIGAMYLLSLAAANALREGMEPCIIELSPMNRNILEGFLRRRGLPPEKVAVEGDLGRAVGYPILIYAVGYDLRPHSRELERVSSSVSFAATHTGSFLGLILKARVLELKEVGSSLFLLKDRRGGEKMYLEMNQLSISEAQFVEKRINREGYNILLDSMTEYGELSVADAVVILQGRLKLTRAEARRLLYELAGEGRIKISGGKVQLG